MECLSLVRQPGMILIDIFEEIILAPDVLDTWTGPPAAAWDLLVAQ